jgi:glutaredoxin
MLKKIQLLQSTTAIAMAIGALTTPVARVQANPSMPTVEPKTTSAPQPVVNSTPKSDPSNGKSVAVGTNIDTVSGAAEIALAEYLVANNIKFYGADWCSHCTRQKSLFGATAAAKLPYIECAADVENSQRQLCKDKNIQMFPTWAIKDKFFPGVKDLKEIATLTGYQGSIDFKYQK